MVSIELQDSSRYVDFLLDSTLNCLGISILRLDSLNQIPICSGWKMKDGGMRDETRFENASIMTEPDIIERIKIERRPQDNRNQQEI